MGSASGSVLGGQRLTHSRVEGLPWCKVVALRSRAVRVGWVGAGPREPYGVSCTTNAVQAEFDGFAVAIRVNVNWVAEVITARASAIPTRSVVA